MSQVVIRCNEFKNITIVKIIMVKLVRTHTYFMTYKEYKKKFLKNPADEIKMRLNENDIKTRTHIIFQSR